MTILNSPVCPVPGTASTYPKLTDRFDLPRTKDGRIKSRLSWEDKLSILDPGSPIEQTEARLIDFGNLFAFRRTRGIIRYADSSDRTWSELRWLLDTEHIARHLLCDRVPTLRTLWIGARSLPTSLWFCVDIDADRGRIDPTLLDPVELARLPEQPRGAASQPSFEERCRQLERALRRMGIDPADPRQVLVLPTPGGGRHYYVFFDGPYFIEQYHDLLRAAGLTHFKGQFEFFPSERQGLRLPFGHIPGRHRDPRAWIQFIDDFRNGRIRRHSLQDLLERLGRHRSRVAARPDVKREPPPNTPPSVGPDPMALGIPRRSRTSVGRAPTPDRSGADRIGRYRELVELGVHSFRDAEELLDLGILLPGTRNDVLKALAGHLVWFRHDTAMEAAEFLKRWAMDRRHDSVDIRADLDHGTDRVPRQIEALCRWAAERKQASASGSPRDGRPRFAAPELQALRTSITSLAPGDRSGQAHFLLHFLNYAKHHGRVAGDGNGWEAAPAINKVVKPWPGCGSNNVYKTRIDRAVEAGLLAMTREKWQNPRGPGRARTYRLSVPLVDPTGWTLSYAEALAFLTGETITDDDPIVSSPGSDPESRSTDHEPQHEPSPGRSDRRAVDPQPLHPRGPGGGLGPDSHQRDPEPTPAEALSDQGPGAGTAPLGSGWPAGLTRLHESGPRRGRGRPRHRGPGRESLASLGKASRPESTRPCGIAETLREDYEQAVRRRMAGLAPDGPEGHPAPNPHVKDGNKPRGP